MNENKIGYMWVIFSLIAVVVIGVAIWFFMGNSSSEDAVQEDAITASESGDDQALEENIEHASIVLASQTVDFSDGTNATFRIAEPFELGIAAEGLGKARFMAMSPDGRLFVPDMVDYKLSHQGKVYVLEDFNESTGQFETKHTYLSNLRGPNSVAFYTDENGQEWLYLALTAHLVRYSYTPGDTKPSGEPEIILEFPNTQAPEAKSVVWHITRTIEFHNGRLYISIGSGCNSCEHPEGELRGMIASINPDGSDVEVYADGLRNSVGFTWVDDVLYATENGADHLGEGAPDELLYKITKGEHYGWPYCYESNGEALLDTSVVWKNPVACEDVPRPLATFKPHAAPLGIEYFENAHEVLNNTFLVALHGSFDPGVQNGYEIVRVTEDGEQEIFMDGFQDATGERYARPLDFMEHDEHSFFFTDDFRGRLYYVTAKSNTDVDDQ